MKTIRCAVYTRKSNEEGLDLAFNSLDAQLEAGLDYIKSQKHEGWEAVKTIYSDGGFSGGTMKRPGLKRLLDDIDKGRIDVVVVYKVDRLSRSLSDFAKMMELFDEKQVSFVSVTQQFNTSTSMGRLTMNMLLSFAQFEREVSGERIRDKIAATKKKGYWVGGTPPLGYRLQRENEPKGIYIIQEEAEIIRVIFAEYSEHQSLVEIANQLNDLGHTTKHWTSKGGRMHGGKPLTAKYIHTILTNRIYIGKITHTRNGKTDVYEGLHQPIIDQKSWDKVHRIMKRQEKSKLHRWTHPHLLKGLLRTHEGFAMSPTSTHRPLSKHRGIKQKRQVHYYISQKAVKHGFKSCQIKTINAEHLDELIRGVVLTFVNNDGLLQQSKSIRDRWIRRVIDEVILAPDSVAVSLGQIELEQLRKYEFKTHAADAPPYPTSLYAPETEETGRVIRLRLCIQIKKLDGRRLLLSPDGHDLIIPSTPEPRQHIVDAIGLAYRWHDDLIQCGMQIRAYAKERGIARSRIMQLLPLIHLGPKVLSHALSGTLPSTITLDDLLIAAKQLDWAKQTDELGLSASPNAAG